MLFGEAKSLVGVVTEPEGDATSRPAVLFLNAGVLHRVGPNRVHVRLARTLAEVGFPSLRFDLSGLGDSRPRRTHTSYVRAMVDETRQAMDVLAKTRGVRSFVLAGICSGADNALRAALEDERVCGAILIEVYTVPSRGFTVYSYRGKLLSPRSWWRLLRGRSELLTSRRPPTEPAATRPDRPPEETVSPPAEPPLIESVLPSRSELVASVRRLVDRGTRLCLVYAATSPAYFNYRVLLRRPLRRARRDQVRLEVLHRTDHVFTPLDVQQRLVDVIRDWCLALPSTD
jgi:pimeloyl-ACP methyl ester carboxylesterase